MEGISRGTEPLDVMWGGAGGTGSSPHDEGGGKDGHTYGNHGDS
jgi:hypothetical protein